jgi:hypothetical protein
MRRFGTILALVLFLYSRPLEARGAECRITATTYVPGAIELGSLRDSLAWQNSYCEKHGQSGADILDILEAVRGVGRRKTCRAPPSQVPHPSLSYFTQTVTCRQGVTRNVTTAVEPLYSILRHPSGIACKEGVNGTTELDYSLLMSTDHIVTADVSCPAVKHARSKIYLDLGASTWREQSQSWMVQHFEDLGIQFDRMLFWEARPMAAGGCSVQCTQARLLLLLPAASQLPSSCHPASYHCPGARVRTDLS